MESPTGEERGGRAEVGVVKLDIVRPLLPSPQTPRCPPAFVIQHGSLVVICPDLHAQHAAPGAHWEKNKKYRMSALLSVSLLDAEINNIFHLFQITLSDI